MVNVPQAGDTAKIPLHKWAREVFIPTTCCEQFTLTIVKRCSFCFSTGLYCIVRHAIYLSCPMKASAFTVYYTCGFLFPFCEYTSFCFPPSSLLPAVLWTRGKKQLYCVVSGGEDGQRNVAEGVYSKWQRPQPNSLQIDSSLCSNVLHRCLGSYMYASPYISCDNVFLCTYYHVS